MKKEILFIPFLCFLFISSLWSQVYEVGLHYGLVGVTTKEESGNKYLSNSFTSIAFGIELGYAIKEDLYLKSDVTSYKSTRQRYNAYIMENTNFNNLDILIEKRFGKGKHKLSVGGGLGVSLLEQVLFEANKYDFYYNALTPNISFRLGYVFQTSRIKVGGIWWVNHSLLKSNNIVDYRGGFYNYKISIIHYTNVFPSLYLGLRI